MPQRIESLLLQIVILYQLAWLSLASLFLSFAADARVLGYHVEDFFRPVAISPPQLSPDGRHVAYAGIRRNRAVVIVRETGDGNGREQILGRSTSEDAVVTSLMWFSNERLIYQYNFGSLFAQNIDYSNRTELYSSSRILVGYGFLVFGDLRIPRVLALDAENPDAVIVHVVDPAAGARVFRVNALTGESEMIEDARRGVFAWWADDRGTVRIGERLDRGTITYLYRANLRGRWQSLDRFIPDEDGGRFAYSGRSLAGRRHTFLGFGGDPDILYFASNTDRDRAALFSFRFSTGERTLLAEDPVHDFHSLDEFQSSPIFSRRTGALAGLVYQADKPRTIWFDSSFSDVQRAMDTHLPGRANRITSMDTDERRFVIYSLSSRDKGTLHLFNRESGEWTLLAEADRRIRPEDMSAMRPIHFTARDGHALYGYVTVPQSRSPDAGPNRTVVLIHGGPWARDFYGYDPTVQWLAHNGFTVLQINFRGSTGYGFAHLDALRRDLGAPAIRDIMDGLDWAIGEGLTDPQQVAAMGASYGGYATLQALAAHPDRFRCGVAIAGVYDLPAQIRHVRDAGSRMSYDFWREMAGGLWNRRELADMSPIGAVEHIRAPVFLAHGKEDRVVPPDQSEAMAAALRALGREPELLLLEDEGHGTGPIRNRIHLYERIGRFLSEHFPEAQP